LALTGINIEQKLIIGVQNQTKNYIILTSTMIENSPGGQDLNKGLYIEMTDHEVQVIYKILLTLVMNRTLPELEHRTAQRVIMKMNQQNIRGAQN
jgi:hypothetical protein